MMTRTSRDDPNQLRMFMTPREILNHYQVLDGDREDYQGESGRGGELTGRSRNTLGNTNYARMVRGTDAEWHRSGDYYRTAPQETDAQVMERKSMEAQMDPDEYAEFRGENPPSEFRASVVMQRSSAPRAPAWSANSSRWESWNAAQDEYLGRKEDSHYRAHANDRSIWDSVRHEGVQQPITLSLPGTSVGSQGKPEILGGHHRLASALDTRPNDYVPVVHAENIWKAKEDPHQKYT